MRTLLVSTDPRVSVEVTTALLGESDVEVMEVRTPQRALALLDDEGGFDVVIADADTAPTGGFALARDIKARVQMGRDMPPVVLLIARDADRFLARWSQADAHLRKPADPFDLAEVVRAVTDGLPVPALPNVGSPQGPPPENVPEPLGSGQEPGVAGVPAASTWL